MPLAVKLVEIGRLSSGQGAALAGGVACCLSAQLPSLWGRIRPMGPEAARLIRQMLPGDDRRNGLFIVGDAHQRICRYKVVLNQCGVNVRGRSRKLRIDYRTTEETRRWAVRLLESLSIDDLDGGHDDQKGYKSLIRGSKPEEHEFKSFNPDAFSAHACLTASGAASDQGGYGSDHGKVP